MFPSIFDEQLWVLLLIWWFNVKIEWLSLFSFVTFRLLVASSKFCFWWTIYINFELEKHGIPNQGCIWTFKHVAFVGYSTHSAIFTSRNFYTQGILDLEVKKSEQHTSPQIVCSSLSREEHHNDANCMFTCRQLRINEIGKFLYPHQDSYIKFSMFFIVK
jgi:hypothetical protein